MLVFDSASVPIRDRHSAIVDSHHQRGRGHLHDTRHAVASTCT